MSNLQSNCCLKFDFQRVDQHAGGKWLIHDTKRHKDKLCNEIFLSCGLANYSWRNKTPPVKVRNSLIVDEAFVNIYKYDETIKVIYSHGVNDSNLPKYF